MSNIYDFYVENVKKYQTEYGSDKTVVFIQVGSFFEIYDDGSGLVDMKAISELLNILVSRRNKNIQEVSKNNVLMAGIPVWAKHKYFATLVAANYTIVLIEQTSDPPNPKRAVTEIISPGVCDNDNIFVSNSNNVVAIYLEEIKGKIAIGYATIDVLTGASYVYETNAVQHRYDDIYRLNMLYVPKEVIVFGEVTDKKALMEMFDGKTKLHDKIRCYERDFLKIVCQNSIIEKVFPNRGMLTGIEYLNMERMPFATIAFVYLLNFTHSHNDTILQRIDPPKILQPEESLILSYNAIEKLEIGQLLDIINNCVTSIGKREFKKRLFSPLYDVEQIKKRYDEIETSLQDKKRLEFVQNTLKNVYDLELILRKICRGKLQPMEWVNINKSFTAILALFENTRAADFVSFYSSCLNLDIIDQYTFDNVETSFFLKDYNAEIDKYQAEYDEARIYFINFTQRLNELSSKTEDIFKLERNDRDGYYIVVTQKRYSEFVKEVGVNKTILDHILVKDLVHKTISSTSSNIRLCHPLFDVKNKEIQALNAVLRKLTLGHYQTFLSEVVVKYESVIKDVIQKIATLDVTVANAMNVIKFGYVRPEVSCSDRGFVDIEKLRHPTIERIINVPYVPNDVCLNDVKTGYLLYGTNSTGKSSLGKSVALAIIMAQSGMYVAASSIKYSPYKKMFARIPSGDDMMKGHSTFVVEMLELRNILTGVDERSFCISDELCNGTESTSGMCIVAAVIETLCKKRASFITASHLHEIVDMDIIKKLDKLRICHLEVSYDEINDILIYDRTLKDGSGSSIYGLEVCRSLGLPSEFLERANELRGVQSLLNTKRSRYNAEVLFDKCEICGAATEEIHHIIEQFTADENGMIMPGVHKNSVSNLMNVCQCCHDEIHSKKIIVKGYKTTSHGRKIITERAEIPEDIDKQVETMIKDGATQKAIMEKFGLTKYKLNKIMKSFM